MLRGQDGFEMQWQARAMSRKFVSDSVDVCPEVSSGACRVYCGFYVVKGDVDGGRFGRDHRDCLALKLRETS